MVAGIMKQFRAANHGETGPGQYLEKFSLIAREGASDAQVEGLSRINGHRLVAVGRPERVEGVEDVRVGDRTEVRAEYRL